MMMMMIINILIFDSYIHVIFKKLAKGEKRKKGMEMIQQAQKQY